MAKRSRRRQKRSWTQTAFWVMSAVLAFSMIISLIIVALPGPATPQPTLPPTWTLAPEPTATPSPVASATPSVVATEPLPTATATESVIGPELPTATPELTATLTPTPTVTVTPTVTPTTSSAAPALIFAVAGDSRDGPNVYRRVLASVTDGGHEFLIHAGDLVNRGTEAQWQGFQEIMAGFTLPFYPVPGNHDGLGGGLEGYLAYSGAPAAHYSFDAGPVHFTLADSHNGGISADELEWIRNDLRSTSQPVKVVVLHHPPFDPDGTDHTMAYGNEQFMDLMVEQGVDTVFAGHIHAYVQGERDGVPYYITGGAGAPLYPQNHPQSFHQYLRVTVEEEEITVEVVKV